MAERGAPRGQRQAVAGPRAIVKDRRSVRTVAVLSPEQHAKGHTVAAALNISMSGYIAMLIERDETLSNLEHADNSWTHPRLSA